MGRGACIGGFGTANQVLSEVLMQTWNAVVEQLLLDPTRSIVVGKSDVEHPIGWGMREVVPCSQPTSCGWRVDVGNCKTLHVYDAADKWNAHLDVTRENCLERKAPFAAEVAATILIGLLAGSVSGLVFHNSAKRGALVGVSSGLIALVVARVVGRT